MRVGDRDDVFRTVRKPKPLGRVKPTPVAALIQGDDVEALGQRPKAAQPVEPAGRAEPVQQHQSGGARRARQLSDEGCAATGNFETAPGRHENFSALSQHA